MNLSKTSTLSRPGLLLAGFALAALFSLQVIAQNTTPSPTIQKLESGVNYSRGDYGLAEDTEVFVVPFNYVAERGPWALRATLPWLQLNGPAAVVAGSNGSVGGPTRPTSSSESGLGDSVVALTYKTNTGPTGPHFNFTGKVKLPTGDEDRGLGTGEVDYQAQVDYYESFGSTTPFMNVGYRVLGDGLYQLEDGLYASGGVAFLVAEGTSIGASLDWRESIVTGGDDAVESTLFAYRKLNADWSTTVYGQKGFTDASPDFGFGVSLSYEF